jgi:hypothetical protein
MLQTAFNSHWFLREPLSRLNKVLFSLLSLSVIPSISAADGGLGTEERGKAPVIGLSWNPRITPVTHRWCPQKWCMRSDSRGAGSPIS